MITKEAVESKKAPAGGFDQFKKTVQFRKPCSVIMGDPGSGKTWFGLSAPSPFLINADDGAAEVLARKGLEYSLDVVPGESAALDAEKWKEVGSTLMQLRDADHGFKTLVVDSLDGMEKLYQAAVCADKDKNSMEDFDYGKGYVFARGKLQKFLNMLKQIRDKRDMEVIICAHTDIKDVNDPRVGTYSTHVLKLHKNANGDVREWSDALLFLAYAHKKVHDRGKFGKVDSTLEQGEERYLLTQGGRGVQCKNRYNLPSELYAEDGEELYDAYWRQINVTRS
jgi:hypothetical protein